MEGIIRRWDHTSFYVANRVYYALFAAAVLFALGFLLPVFFQLAILLLLFVLIAAVVEAFLLYQRRQGLAGERLVDERLSNGDENRVLLRFFNHYPYKLRAQVIDELPFQFQDRAWRRTIQLPPGAATELPYVIRPQERGEYRFGDINVYLEGPLGLVRRRYRLPASQDVKVYPSFVQMRRYQLVAVATHQQQSGVKRVRKLGHSMEFEQIKEYVRGDDYRTINWKATARRGDLMVNSFTDERSQQIYCLINKGRVMKMPFDGMTLMDYAINAALTLSGIALQKQDRAGLITFAQGLDQFLPADRKPTQINQILEALYRQETVFGEPDFEKLFSAVRNRITQRSLLVLFTNFESIESLQREMPFLKRLAHYHLLMVVFFENTELKALTEARPSTIEDVYIQTIAEKYRHEKRLIVKELQAQGIIAVLSTPAQLTVSTLNKYLELKNRQSI